ADSFEYLAQSGFVLAQGPFGPVPLRLFLYGVGGFESSGEIGDDRARLIADGRKIRREKRFLRTAVAQERPGMVFQRNGLARENAVVDRLGRLPYLAPDFAPRSAAGTRTLRSRGRPMAPIVA